MKVAIQNWIVCNYDDYKQASKIKKAGFNYTDWDLTRYYLNKSTCEESFGKNKEYNTALRAHFDKLNLEVYQTHTLFPTYLGDKEEKVLKGIENCFLATNILGAKYTVVHPVMPKKWEGEQNRQLRVKENISFYNKIKPLAIKYNVKIAIENMFGYPCGIGKYNETSCSRYEEMKEIFDGLLDEEHFCFCLDTGHANMTFKEKMVDAIKTFGHNLEIVHLHDNNGLMDWHRGPGHGNVKWEEILPALYEYANVEVYNWEICPLELGVINKDMRFKNLNRKINKLMDKFHNQV